MDPARTYPPKPVRSHLPELALWLSMPPCMARQALCQPKGQEAVVGHSTELFALRWRLHEGMAWSSWAELLLAIGRGGHHRDWFAWCKDTYLPFSLPTWHVLYSGFIPVSQTWDLNALTSQWHLWEGHWRLHKQRSPVQLLLQTTVLVSSDGLIKGVWSLSNLMHRAEVEEKVLFIQKGSLFRAFWTSQCFSLPCQAFNGRRKVLH